jgi:hypothetical protein
MGVEEVSSNSCGDVIRLLPRVFNARKIDAVLIFGGVYVILKGAQTNGMKAARV